MVSSYYAPVPVSLTTDPSADVEAIKAALEAAGLVYIEVDEYESGQIIGGIADELLADLASVPGITRIQVSVVVYIDPEADFDATIDRLTAHPGFSLRHRLTVIKAAAGEADLGNLDELRVLNSITEIEYDRLYTASW